MICFRKPILTILWTLVRELLVFDVLGKRGCVAQVLETSEGERVLKTILLPSPEANAGQESS
jgi:hypothetical protein